MLEFFKKEIFEEIFLKGNIGLSVKWVKIICYYLIPLLLVMATIIIGLSSDIGSMFNFSKFTGNASINIVILILFIKPVSMIFFRFGLFRKLMMFRRQFGILAFYFAFFHFIAVLMHNYLQLGYNFYDVTSWYFMGTAGMIIMFILYLTSNNLSMRILKLNWKKLQKITYFVLPIIAIHIMLVRSSSQSLTLNGFFEGFGFLLLAIVFFLMKTLESKGYRVDFPKEKPIIAQEENRNSQF